jgi:hypothetical protein
MSADTLIGRADTSGIAGEITLGGNLVLKSNVLSANTSNNYRIITTSQTFNTPADTTTSTLFKITAVGGGGGGGGVNGGTTAAGGGAGASAILYVTNLTPGTALSCVIGAGGTGGLATTGSTGTSGGNTQVTGTGISILCTGGSGGVGQIVGSAAIYSFTNGGTATGGTVNISGKSGTGGIWGYNWGVCGTGGDTILGLGGSQDASGNALPGRGYGSGGAGGQYYTFTNGGVQAYSAKSGANGAGGVVIIEWVQ